ncbi:MAG: PEP-CTERM sorting domain-containing protein [Phycisphaerales bacterium]|nr:MAG: PEP-CTERM sorting domain-containing protein [Phycisphaerales bacterium]
MTKATVAAACLVVAGAAHASLYEQAADLNDPGTGYWSAAYAGTYHDYLHADNFTLGAGGLVGGVTWWGGSENYVWSDLTNFVGWEVTFYDDAGGLPGNVLYSEYFDKAATNPMDTGYVGWQGSTVYSHEVSLTSAVNLSGGTQYWISIGVDPASDALDGWWWQKSESVDNLGGTFYYPDGFWTQSTDFDVTFGLIEVPAPGALALLGVAGLMRRRRR